VISLHYDDDIIFFLENDLDKARNMKMILTYFEKMFGMKLNYNKSEMIPMNLLDQEKENFKNIFGYLVRVFPTKYLGIPLHYEKIKRGDLQPLVDKIVKRILQDGEETFVLCWENSPNQNLSCQYSSLSLIFL
jgi:hypothetical protein